MTVEATLSKSTKMWLRQQNDDLANASNSEGIYIHTISFYTASACKQLTKHA